MKKQLFLLLLFFPLAASAIKGLNLDYDWDAHPVPYTASGDESTHDALYLLDKYVDEYYLINYMSRYELKHVRILLNTDKGIEHHNKFYVWTKGATEIYKLKARVIQPSGKIIELNESNIIESKDEYGVVRYRYFAFEGVEKGSVVEYLHYLRFAPAMSAMNYYLGHSYIDVNDPDHKKKLDASIIVGGKLLFNSYSNGAYAFRMEEKEADNGRDYTVYQLDLEDVAALPDESYSFEAHAQQRMFYTVNSEGMGSYKEWKYDYLATLLNTHYYTMLFPVSIKHDLRDLFDEAVTGAGASPTEKLRAFENKIKTEYSYVEDALFGPNEINKTKKISEDGLICMMLFAADELGLQPQLVMTCDRRDVSFPADFPSMVFIRETMLYFPTLDLYYKPTMASRIGPAEYEFTDNNAVFFTYDKPRMLEPTESQIKTVAVPPIEHTVDVINTHTTIDPETFSAKIHVDRSLSGYFARPYQADMSYLSEEERKKLKEEFFTFVVSETAQLGAYSFENDNSNAYNTQPLIGHADATSTTLVSDAGNKLLVNLGTLIGEQFDLYNEKSEGRRTRVDFRYLHAYKRSVVIEIPEGYRAVNLSDLEKATQPDAANNSIGFTTSYKLEGNTLTVSIDEWYKQLTYPKEEYQYVIDVTNAAADFNKVVLVLEKL